MSNQTTNAASEKTTTLVGKLDSKINARLGYTANRLADWLALLIETGSVEVGWRQSCGSTDETHKIYRDWLKVVKSLNRGGFRLAEESVKHKNGSPTRSGGFWQSIVYSIEK